MTYKEYQISSSYFVGIIGVLFFISDLRRVIEGVCVMKKFIEIKLYGNNV